MVSLIRKLSRMEKELTTMQGVNQALQKELELYRHNGQQQVLDVRL
jgi:hypothetical protein